MDAHKRYKTKYPGVFFRKAKRIGGNGTEKVYYAVFKSQGKVIEEKLGRQFKDKMTDSKASKLRSQLIEGTRITRKEKKILSAKKKWTFEVLWDEYKKGREPTKSLQIDDLRYTSYIKSPLGCKEPRELIQLDIDRIKLTMKKSKKAPQTVKHVLSLVRRIASFGLKKGLSQDVPFKIQSPPVDNKTTEDLTADELSRLIQAIEADSNKTAATIMKLALFTGMRKGEIFKLQWDHINFHRGFIAIKAPKGGKDQDIPLNSEVEKLLTDWPDTPGSPFVFPGKSGGQRVSIAPAVKRIRDNAGLPSSFRPLHGLRHVYASMLASSGKVDMYTLQKLLTHKSPIMTQRYAHLRDEAMKKAADLAGNIIDEAITVAQNEAKAELSADISKIKKGSGNG